MHNLIVAQNQDKMLMIGIDHREVHLSLVEPSVNRFAAHVEQKVVHPSHVPLEPETESSQVGWSGDARPRSGFFCDGHDSRKPLVTDFVKAFDEIDSVEVLAAAMDVRHPFTRFSRVVEIKHRSDCVDAKTIDVIVVQPEQAICDKKIAYLVSTVIKDQGTPISMFTLAGISVFVKMGSIEQSETMRILWEMSGNPVDDDAESVFVSTIDKMPKLIGVPEPARRGEVAGNLIAPGSIEGMLGDRHQFEMRITQVLHIRDQTIGEADIAQESITFFWNPGPRSKMNFVDADGLFVPLLRFPGLNPLVIAPFETIQIEYQGSRLDSMLPVESEGITFQDDLTKTVSHFELVMGPFHDAGDENLPDPGFDPFSHRMTSTIPAIEITYDADALGVGTPDGKSCACMPINLGQMSAQFFVDVVVVAFLVEVHIKLTENWAIGVRVTHLEGLSGPLRDLQQIVKGFCHSGQRCFKQALVCNTVRWKMTLRVMPIDHR